MTQNQKMAAERDARSSGLLWNPQTCERAPLLKDPASFMVPGAPPPPCRQQSAEG